jgi:hypothetical protein
MEDEIHFDGEKCTYLLPSGFSGADIFLQIVFGRSKFVGLRGRWISYNQCCLFLIWEVK